MKIEGFIYGQNNDPITATVAVADTTGNQLSMLEIPAGSKYVLDYSDSVIRDLTVIFAANGYHSLTTTGAELIDSGSNIHLEKSNTLVLLLIAAGLFYALRDKKKTVGAVTVQNVIPFVAIAAAVFSFKLLEQLLQMLGIWKKPETKVLDTAATDPNSFWNPEYWKTKPANVSYTRPITESTARNYADQIYNAFGIFDDCEECVKTVFRSMPSQAAASFVSWAFTNKYGSDLLDFLRGGIWPKDRLSDTDVAEINNYVNQLPKY